MPKLSQADFNLYLRCKQMYIRWTESAEEASAGAELVVEAILEDLQVSTSLEGTWKSTSLECTLKVPRKYRIHMTLVWYSLYYKIVVKPSLDLINKRLPLTQMDVDMCVCAGWSAECGVSNAMAMACIVSLNSNVKESKNWKWWKVKRDLFARIDSAAPPSTILASNTSRWVLDRKPPDKF